MTKGQTESQDESSLKQVSRFSSKVAVIVEYWRPASWARSNVTLSVYTHIFLKTSSFLFTCDAPERTLSFWGCCKNTFAICCNIGLLETWQIWRHRSETSCFMPRSETHEIRSWECKLVKRFCSLRMISRSTTRIHELEEPDSRSHTTQIF